MQKPLDWNVPWIVLRKSKMANKHKTKLNIGPIANINKKRHLRNEKID